MRHIDSGMDAGHVESIDKRLDAVIKSEDVRIPLAVESGSRAWGFPSPDSDYDCRFVFVRNRDSYLSLRPLRDVIETELTPVLDVNGWDIGKALRLMLNGNAVIIEWLLSPIVYRGDQAFRDNMLALADVIAERRKIFLHYLHLNYSMRNRLIEGIEEIALKKLFYVLRPSMALRHMRHHANKRLPPMHFPTLMAEADIESGLYAIVQDLMARKAVTNELGRGLMPEPVKRFVLEEIAAAEEHAKTMARDGRDHMPMANSFFRQTIKQFG
jgi:uncharacterized protein